MATEGGYQCNRSDDGNWSGGRVGRGNLAGTKYGISAALMALVMGSVSSVTVGVMQRLTMMQAREIATERFWQVMHCDALPAGVDVMLFDFGFNSEPEAPPLNEKPWRNPATGKTVMVPEGIDPGFQSNPGRDWAMGEKERAATRMTPIVPTGEDAQPARREETQKRQIQEILKVKSGSVEAGTAPEALQEALDVKTDSVLLSGDTLSKNLSRHPDLDAVDYLRLPTLIADPVAIVADTKPTSLVLVSYRGGQHYRTAIKRTKDGTLLFLESFLKFSRERAEALIKSRGALWGDLPPLDSDKPKSEEEK